MIAAAHALLESGPEALWGPESDAFVDEVSCRHPAGETYRARTVEAMARCSIADDTSRGQFASDIYRHFIWTHFAAKLVMAATPAAAFGAVLQHVKLDELLRASDAIGPAILSGFHYTGYPLIALSVAMSPAAPLITKARVDVLERSDSASRLNDRVVYLSDRSAPLRLTRALKQGQSIWAMPDVVLPSVRTVQVQFLGCEMEVVAGLGRIAQLSRRPALPLFWVVESGVAALHPGPPILPEESEQEFIQTLVTGQADFVAHHPTHWLEWYSLLTDAPLVRAEVKQGNETMWSSITAALQ